VRAEYAFKGRCAVADCSLATSNACVFLQTTTRSLVYYAHPADPSKGSSAVTSKSREHFKDSLRLYVSSVVTSGAATLPQQEKDNTKDLPRKNNFYRLYMHSGKVTLAKIHIRRVLGAAAQNLGVCRWRGQAEPFLGRKPPQARSQRLRLQHKISAWASSGPAGGRCEAACLWRWRALPWRGPPSGQRQHFPIDFPD
jgi:hypothetical protein